MCGLRPQPKDVVLAMLSACTLGVYAFRCLEMGELRASVLRFGLMVCGLGNPWNLREVSELMKFPCRGGVWGLEEAQGIDQRLTRWHRPISAKILGTTHVRCTATSCRTRTAILSPDKSITFHKEAMYSRCTFFGCASWLILL